jgi:hypothetical protein
VLPLQRARRVSRVCFAATGLFVSAFFLPSDAAAYMGPGAGLTALGSLVALLGALVLLVVGFIWYPVRRLLRQRKSDRSPVETPPNT